MPPKRIAIIIVAVVSMIIVVGVSIFLLSSTKPSSNVTPIVHKEKRHSDKGIYITYYMAKTTKAFTAIKERAKKAGINTLVIDAKWSLEGPLLELAKEHKLNKNTKVEPDPWFSELVKQLHDEGFIISARLVVFKDDRLVLTRKDLGVRLGNDIYRDHKGGKWSDPYSDEVKLYNALIAERAAMCGVDEIQFDYVRFPAEGKARDAVFTFQKEGVTRVDAICSYLAEVKERVKKYNVSLAVDIFGVTAWQSKVDIVALGQDLKRMAPYLDVLSPMLYPSHFHAGYDGHRNPGSEPYYFMATGVKQAKVILSGEAVAVVPWIQGFNMSSPNFGPDYIRQQVKACADNGVDSFLIWNARNDYGVSFTALE